MYSSSQNTDQFFTFHRYFEEAAIDILTKAARENVTKTYKLLELKLPLWRENTILSLAFKCKRIKFLAHPVVQKKLTRKWFGRMVHSMSKMKVILLSSLLF